MPKMIDDLVSAMFDNRAPNEAYRGDAYIKRSQIIAAFDDITKQGSRHPLAGRMVEILENSPIPTRAISLALAYMTTGKSYPEYESIKLLFNKLPGGVASIVSGMGSAAIMDRFSQAKYFLSGNFGPRDVGYLKFILTFDVQGATAKPSAPVPSDDTRFKTNLSPAGVAAMRDINAIVGQGGLANMQWDADTQRLFGNKLEDLGAKIVGTTIQDLSQDFAGNARKIKAVNGTSIKISPDVQGARKLLLAAGATIPQPKEATGFDTMAERRSRR